MLAFASGSLTARAGPISGTLYYTTFSGTERVHSVDFSYNGSNSFVLSNKKDIAATPGGDGLVFTTDGQLAVGGQGNAVYKVNPTNGNFTTHTAGGTDAYHMMATPDGHILSSSIPGTPAVYPGNLSSNGVALRFVGNGADQFVDTISFDNKGNAFYTSSGSGGNGAFGRITLDLTNHTYSTQRLIDPLPAAHGMSFDPFTNDLILFGDNHITQIDPTTGQIVSDLTLSLGSTFDQGTVDGKGHIFAANNGGDLAFIDYSTTGLVGAASNLTPGTPKNFIATPFLSDFLDDVAPLIGPGAAAAPEPSSVVLLSLGGLALMGCRYRRRRAA
jgi:hypothetical protein